jgi:hypothetical protein
MNDLRKHGALLKTWGFHDAHDGAQRAVRLSRAVQGTAAIDPDQGCDMTPAGNELITGCAIYIHSKT